MQQISLLQKIKKSSNDEEYDFDLKKFYINSHNCRIFNYIINQKHFCKQQIIVGPRFSGKSHLRYIWQKKNNALALYPKLVDFDYRNLISKYNAFYIEDLHHWTLTEHKFLFDLLNIIVFEQSKYLLITSSKLPTELNMQIPDLSSRLLMIYLQKIQSPDEDLMKNILHKRFKEIQVIIDPYVLNFIISRIDRTFLAIENTVQKIFSFSLEYNLPITIPIVKQILH